MAKKKHFQDDCIQGMYKHLDNEIARGRVAYQQMLDDARDYMQKHVADNKPLDGHQHNWVFNLYPIKIKGIAAKYVIVEDYVDIMDRDTSYYLFRQELPFEDGEWEEATHEEQEILSDYGDEHHWMNKESAWHLTISETLTDH